MNKPIRVAATATNSDSPFAAEVARRRTFAIISHPDAGKTTLTEKLLLFGGAINLAGQVKAKKNRRNTRSDWMEIERERGISVATSVMTFEYDDRVFNLLDTPGHEDFSEDTYRTLTAVDSAVMVIDAAKGIEARTLKLFEVCRLRDIPIVTFINKMDRESRDPFELLDEIEKTLALDTAPITWPIGRGRDFIGTFDVASGSVRLMEEDGRTGSLQKLDFAALAALNPNLKAAALAEEFALAKGACKRFDGKSFLEGHLTPVFFGSALKNFGVADLLDAIGAFAPPPRAQAADVRLVAADEPRMTAFVFKIQANMDPNHRDRIAFARLCSGKLARGMKAKQVRTGKSISLHTPQFFFAQDRALADEAYAGDVVGIPNHGTLRIGDTLTEGEELNFMGVPSFAPEIIRRVKLGRRDEGEEVEAGAAADGGRGSRPGIPPARRLAGTCRRRRCPANRRAEGPARRRVRAGSGLRKQRIPACALDIVRGTQEARGIRRIQALLDCRRPRRRSRLPRSQPVRSRIYGRTRRRNWLRRH